LTPGEWAHIKGKKRFRDRYAFSRCDLWAFWTAAVIVHARSFLLRDFRTARELQAERLDRARLKAAKRQAAETNRDGTPFKRSPEERAKTAEGMRRYWATKKAKS
jgi:hypothetical protein